MRVVFAATTGPTFVNRVIFTLRGFDVGPGAGVGASCVKRPCNSATSSLITRLRRLLPGGPVRTTWFTSAVVGPGRTPRACRPRGVNRQQERDQRHGVFGGAGPGDPGLVTLCTAELLADGDVVVYDRWVHPAVLGRVRSGARLMFVGKEGDGESTSQVDVLISQAKWGRSFDVLPGVSSGIAAPLLAGIPVSTSTFATDHLADRDPDRPKFALAETLALFTARQRLAHVASSLSPAGHSQSTPASLVVSGSWASQHVIDGTLATLGQELEAHERTQSQASGAPWRLHEVIGPALAPRRDPKPPLRSFS